MEWVNASLLAPPKKWTHFKRGSPCDWRNIDTLVKLEWERERERERDSSSSSPLAAYKHKKLVIHCPLCKGSGYRSRCTQPLVKFNLNVNRLCVCVCVCLCVCVRQANCRRRNWWLASDILYRRKLNKLNAFFCRTIYSSMWHWHTGYFNSRAGQFGIF